MNCFKKWLVQKYLPAYVKESVLEELKYTTQLLNNERNRTAKLSAYIQGLERALKCSKNVTVNIIKGGAEDDIGEGTVYRQD